MYVFKHVGLAGKFGAKKKLPEGSVSLKELILLSRVGKLSTFVVGGAA